MSFAWSAPDSCPDAASVRGRVEQRLGGASDVDGHAIAVTITRDGDAYVARIGIDDAERTLTDTSCDELADAVAVIVARLASEHRDAVPPPPPALSPPSPPLPAPAVESTGHWQFGGRLAGVSALGILPGLGVGAEVAAVVEHAPFRAELAGIEWASKSQAADGFDVSHVDVGLRAAALRFGWRVGDLPIRVGAAAELGTMIGTGAHSGSGTWLAVGGGFAAWWQAMPRLRVVGATEVDLARDRVRFQLSDGMLEYESGDSSLRITLGVEVGIP